MKILYVHGFGSHYDPTHEKILALKTIGTVYGVDVDYARGFDHVYTTVKNAVLEYRIDIIVGTSMGGYMAAHVGSRLGIPFVAMNPALQPSVTLERWAGAFVDFSGKSHYMNMDQIHQYPDIATTGYGLILVETGDEILPSNITIRQMSHFFRVEVFQGGSHRFTHIEKALPLILDHYVNAASTLGLE
jgi:uncharacterized protein